MRKERCSGEKTAAFSRREHSWISLRAQARRHVHATTLLRSHAVSTLGSLSVRKEACSGEKTAAFSRREHSWISLLAQRYIFHRKDCRVLTPRAHLDLAPCASKKTCSCDRLLRSHATGTLGSLRAQRDMFRQNDCCVLTPRAHLDFAPCSQRHVLSKRLLRSCAAPQDRGFLPADARSSFYSQARTRPLRYREPVTRNPETPVTAPLLHRL